MGGFADFARFDGVALAELVRRGEVAPIDDVNFWQPNNVRPITLPEGAPWLFKLHVRNGGFIVGGVRRVVSLRRARSAGRTLVRRWLGRCIRVCDRPRPFPGRRPRSGLRARGIALGFRALSRQ